MRHVDEGTIHAWLDQQVTDPQEVAWITAHLRECATCSARVADEESTIRDAEALLSSVAPYADGSREAFEALVAGAAQQDGAGERVTPGGGITTSGRSHPWWMVSAGWAATIALAVGLGWSARYLMSSRGAVAQAPSPAPQQMARADSPDRGTAERGPEAPSAGASVAPSTQPPSVGQRVAPFQGTAPKSMQPSRGAETKQAPPENTGERVRTEASPRPGAGPDVAGQSPDDAVRSLPSLLGLVPSPPQAAPPPPIAVPFRASENVNVTAEAPVVDVQNARQQVAPPAPSGSAERPAVESTRAAAAPPEPPAAVPAPAAPAAGAGRGGGRGGAGGGRGGGGRGRGTPDGSAAVGGTGQFAAGTGSGFGPGVGGGVVPVPTPPTTDNLTQGRLIVDGVPIGGTESADGIDWQVVAREAARARSGMPLYGIDGLNPARTMVSPDGSKVRTVYAVNAAEVVLLQERRTATDSLRDQAEVPTRWSSVRGDVVLTVQGLDAAGLGARVRLD